VALCPRHGCRILAINRRRNRLLTAGFRLLRFTASDVLRTPELVVAQVRAALATT
jgi:very-short-patch-repair endonuclease